MLSWWSSKCLRQLLYRRPHILHLDLSLEVIRDYARFNILRLVKLQISEEAGSHHVGYSDRNTSLGKEVCKLTDFRRAISEQLNQSVNSNCYQDMKSYFNRV